MWLPAVVLILSNPYVDIKFVLLHEHRLEDGIKNFFLEIWEAYLKVSMRRELISAWLLETQLTHLSVTSHYR